MCCENAHPHNTCHHDWSTDWLGCRWFQWNSMAVQQQRQHQYYRRSFWRLRVADAAGHFTIVGPDRFQIVGLTFVDSLNCLFEISIGRCACMVLSAYHAKLSACVQPMKAATIRHDSTLISSLGAISNLLRKNLTDEFNSKSVLRRTSIDSRNGASAISCDHADAFVYII